MVTNRTIQFLLTIQARIQFQLREKNEVLWCIDQNEEEAEANIKLGLITRFVRLNDKRYCSYAITKTGNDYVAHIKELLNVK